MPNIEQKILSKLVDDILAAGHRITVFDGEEDALKRSDDKAAILEACGSTCWDWLKVFDKQRYVGAVMLVWGNGADLISDYAAKGDEGLAEVEALCAGADQIAESAA